MKATVLRVEDRDGLGFYQQIDRFVDSRLRDKIFSAFCDYHSHPAPRNDKGHLGMWYNSGDTHWEDFTSMFYGFRDEVQMIDWMVEGIDVSIFNAMVDCGAYFIKRYQIDEHHVIYGERQLVFKKSEAICVESLPYVHMRELIRRF